MRDGSWHSGEAGRALLRMCTPRPSPAPPRPTMMMQPARCSFRRRAPRDLILSAVNMFEADWGRTVQSAVNKSEVPNPGFLPCDLRLPPPPAPSRRFPPHRCLNRFYKADGALCCTRVTGTLVHCGLAARSFQKSLTTPKLRARGRSQKLCADQHSHP